MSFVLAIMATGALPFLSVFDVIYLSVPNKRSAGILKMSIRFFLIESLRKAVLSIYLVLFVLSIFMSKMLTVG